MQMHASLCFVLNCIHFYTIFTYIFLDSDTEFVTEMTPLSLERDASKIRFWFLVCGHVLLQRVGYL